MAKPSIHVVANGKKWIVEESKTHSVISTHYKKETAVSAGTRAAKEEHTELTIHLKNGQIQNKNSFGKDSFPPKG